MKVEVYKAYAFIRAEDGKKQQQLIYQTSSIFALNSFGWLLQSRQREEVHIPLSTLPQ